MKVQVIAIGFPANAGIDIRETAENMDLRYAWDILEMEEDEYRRLLLPEEK